MICDSLPSPTCQVSFSDSIVGLTAHFNSQINPIPSPQASFFWDFGDGNIDTLANNPIHTYLQPGNYQVCLNYSDTINACQALFCKTITIPSTCSITIDHISNGPDHFFTSEVLPLPNFPGTYSWDFGDGNFSSDEDPFYQYASGGNYQVCLTYSDSSGCSGVVCDSVSVNYNPGGLRISGNITLAGLPLQNSSLILLQETLNPTGSGFIEIDTVPSFNGDFNFYNLNSNNYLIHAIPDLDLVNPGPWLPTYWPTGLFWDDGASIVLNQTVNGVQLNVMEESNFPIGPGKISGTIKDENGFGMPDLIVGLQDSVAIPFNYLRSTQGGAFAFNDLPFGLYWLGIDLPGYPTVKKAIRIDSNHLTDSSNFSIINGWLISHSRPVPEELQVKVYPKSL